MDNEARKNELRAELAKLQQGSQIEGLLEAASALSNAMPVLGGVVAAYLSGAANDRKAKRVINFFDLLTNALEGLQSDVSNNYVRTEDFADLFDETLRRVASERYEEKQKVYRNILVGAIKLPNRESYDERLTHLQTLERLQTAHLQVFRAVLEEPIYRFGMVMSSSRLGTLESRLSDYSRNDVAKMVDELGVLRLLRTRNIDVSMSAEGAQDLRVLLTDYGKQFIQYLNS